MNEKLIKDGDVYGHLTVLSKVGSGNWRKQNDWARCTVAVFG
jgi:hypothetical protein